MLWVRDYLFGDDEKWKKVVFGIVTLLIAFWVLRGCIPGLDPNHLPADLNERIEKRYVKCIDYYPIFPGERRQPDCGQVKINVVGEGKIPPERAADGVTRAICYRVSYDNPSITTSGGVTTHDIFWHGRSASKVTVEQNGEWVLYDDLDTEDELRWLEYGCEGDYADAGE